VVFELPDFVEVGSFAQGVGVNVLDSAYRQGDTWLVEVALSPDASIASVLRRAEAWLANSGLGGIWFHLDGRLYLLQQEQRAEAA
jgi:hypothetical protein